MNCGVVDVFLCGVDPWCIWVMLIVGHVVALGGHLFCYKIVK